MDIVVKGRNVEVPDHYRVHVQGKLDRLGRYDRKIVRFDVELFHEPNRRQHKSCQRVEITTVLRGQTLRAEASAGDFYAALDCASAKLENRLRRMHDRRRVHYGRRSPTSVAEAAAGQTADVTAVAGHTATAVLEAEPETDETTTLPDAQVPRPRDESTADDQLDEHLPGQVVRVKTHSATPMNVDQALSEMELVGHDFYLFHDVDSDRPSVVYRRQAFDYGLIRLA